MIINKRITINADRLGLVLLRLEQFNKKALKLKIEPCTIISQSDRIIKERVKNEWTGNYSVILRPVIDIELIGHDIKYGNYTHVATLDHTTGDLPIIKTVPLFTVPEHYEHAKPHCDHCNIARQRNRTFIFQDQNGFKQVGSSCLKEFFGIDPTATIDWFQSFYGFNDEEYIGSDSAPYESNLTVLALALALVEKNGYTSTKQANERQMVATKDAVLLLLHPVKPINDECRAYISSMWLRAEELKSKAEELIGWGVTKFADESGDYAHNMRIFLGAEYTKEHYFGYLVSVIGAYNRDLDQLNKADVGSDNDWLGLVGDKVTINVIVNKVIVSEGNYGLSYINIMTQDITGNNVVWFGSNKVLNDGEKVTLKGSIKALNDRDGKKQTILTRCKIV